MTEETRPEIVVGRRSVPLPRYVCDSFEHSSDVLEVMLVEEGWAKVRTHHGQHDMLPLHWLQAYWMEAPDIATDPIAAMHWLQTLGSV